MIKCRHHTASPGYSLFLLHIHSICVICAMWHCGVWHEKPNRREKEKWNEKKIPSENFSSWSNLPFRSWWCIFFCIHLFAHNMCTAAINICSTERECRVIICVLAVVDCDRQTFSLFVSFWAKSFIFLISPSRIIWILRRIFHRIDVFDVANDEQKKKLKRKMRTEDKSPNHYANRKDMFSFFNFSMRKLLSVVCVQRRETSALSEHFKYCKFICREGKWRMALF